MGPRALRGAFGGASDARIMRSLLLRLRDEIREGRIEQPRGGNLRTIGYRYVLPVWSRLDHVRAEVWYTRLVRAMRRLVTDWGELGYRDLGISDENWETRRIGTTRPEVIAFGEDLDLFRVFKRAHEALGITAVAFGRGINVVTVEYTAAHVLARLRELGRPPRVRLLAFTDWDPSGYDNAHVFQRRLADFGVTATSLELMVRPDALPPELLRQAKIPMRRRGAMKVALDRWVHETGGIDGEPYKLESGALGDRRLYELLVAAVG